MAKADSMFNNYSQNRTVRRDMSSRARALKTRSASGSLRSNILNSSKEEKENRNQSKTYPSLGQSSTLRLLQEIQGVHNVTRRLKAPNIISSGLLRRLTGSPKTGGKESPPSHLVLPQ